ncbi:MAG: MBL fold metallo-hydrolase [Polyangiaceae bacterium]|nr:MBL fold metallo-hydrolase [Polyangiaceae bacterium]
MIRSTLGRGLLALAFAGYAGCASGGAPRPAAPPVPPRAPDPAFTLTAFDVGTGLAILVQGEDFSLLYDAGSNDDRRSGEQSRVLAYLAQTLGASSEPGCDAGDGAAPSPKARLDHVFLSHPHRDHLSHLPDVLRCYPVTHVWEPGLASDTKGYAAFRDAVGAEPGVTHHVAGEHFEAGQRLDLGRRAAAAVLSVRPDAKDPNDASIVLRLELGRARVLLTGDATGGARRDPPAPPDPGSTERALLDLGAAALAADVLFVGHHGSKTSTRAAFLEAVRPKIAVISSGPMAYSGVVLPDPEVVDLLRSRGVEVHRTDTEDEACASAPAKVGSDADGAPGGCSAVTLRIDPTGAVSVIGAPHG